jgi:hypothetical protein
VLRTIGHQLNTQVYHMVMYQSFNDKLRIVYKAVIEQLR